MKRIIIASPILAAALLFITIIAFVPIPSTIAVQTSNEPREAYFNGSSYLRLLTPMPMWKHSAFSIRTCRGGEILSQRYAGHIFLLSVHSDSVSISLVTPSAHIETRVPCNLLDNKWHTIEFLYQLGNLKLLIDRKETTIANSTYNTLLLTDPPRDEAAILILGTTYSGCMLHGPGLNFNTSVLHPPPVLFGPCPLMQGPCTQHDVLVRAPVDHCLHDPCMQKGVCVSKTDTYECHCTARYSGKNCEIDIGPPCRSEPCYNGARCSEDNRGDYQCHCTPGFTGVHCETEISVHPLCESKPCLNNGTCKIAPGTSKIECECTKGFIGARCEIDWDDCESQPCQNGGVCVDEVGGFHCNCSGTGYSGTLCQNNVDECVNQNPCLNGGICYDTYGSYICECTSNFSGLNCEQPIDACMSQPCGHGGTCIDRKDGGSVECICLPGFTGEFCENGPACVRECPVDTVCIGGQCCVPDATGTECKNTVALPLDDCTCLNGGTCTANSSVCVCPPGFEGKRCERLDTCNTNNCQEPMACSAGKCICPEHVGSCNGGCATGPCLNGGTCHNRGTSDFYCQCPSGWTGLKCDLDVDECQTAGTCGHGICVNQPGSFKCYCEPGFTGALCDLDVDECLGHPCKNNATCINKVNDFQCICPPGYNGKDCSNDIDECLSHPCFAGSTCIDGIADYTCVCINGMTGRNCETDIDDCESQPCQHGGQCKDELGGFHCNCTGTGFSGDYCQVNIDECEPSPCENGAVCVDKVNDYQCNCNVGYAGKNCEIDIDECESSPCQNNGVCLQRSNITLYSLPNRHTLPSIFSGEFSYENASGYECICIPGIIGINCEHNINECEGDPCHHGTCHDEINAFTCECDVGYEGTLCESEINECEKFTPCIHGKCFDRIGFYDCKCDALWGGKNCSVMLIGCQNSPCMNDGICTPSLENETQHHFNCTCSEGFQGDRCEKDTTLSLGKNSLVTVNTNRVENYDINLRFRTTLPNGILVFGSGGGSVESLNRFILELVNGRLNLHSPLLNKWEGVFIGSGLNNSEWHKVVVAINSTHLLLSANEETTIYPINQYDSNTSYTTFPVTYMGGAIPRLTSYLRHLTHAASSFVGCMQDVTINNQWVFPLEKHANQTLENVEPGCHRVAQCDPNPCGANGQCIDEWHTFSCSCQRPHLGDTCQHNIIAATFGHENTTHSVVFVNVTETARRMVRSVLDISMFIRTRQPTGQVFYLGSDPKKSNANLSFVSAKLNGGELLVKLQINGTSEEQPVGGNRLDNGYTHLLQVIRNLTLVQVKINGTEYFRKTLSSTGQLDAETLYLGGPPTSFQQVDDIDYDLTKEDLDKVYFKGIIQDVQVSNGSQSMIVEMFPLQDANLKLPRRLGTVIFDDTSILKGEVSDDLCRKQPCQHSAICKNTWNDFVCICPRGYKGKYCQDTQFCELQQCPGNGICQNLDDGFECITNMTFQGEKTNPLSFTFHHKNPVLPETNPIKSTIEIAFRTKTGGTLLYVQNQRKYFEIAIYKNQVTLQWNLTGELPEIRRFNQDNPNFDWQTLVVSVQDDTLKGSFKGYEEAYDAHMQSTSAPIDQNEFMELFSGKYLVYLGGMPLVESTLKPKGDDNGAAFKGCLGEARIGGLLLPYFLHDEVYLDKMRPRSHFRLSSAKPDEGCVLCFQQDCENGGICTNPSEVYACTCPAGYEDDTCSSNIDECLTANCLNNSTCIDLIANYTCKCLPGFEGQHCESEINECLSNPCHNGGNCTDLLAAYSCECTEDYAGPQCDILRLVTCENLPCRSGSTCIDGHNATTGNNFTCTCRPGYQGALCDIPFCSVEPCKNGGFCLTTGVSPVCTCSLGYTGVYCETDINECESAPCQNGGECIDLIGQYKCRCSGTGFEGINCETDIDECVVERINCGNRGVCVNTLGSYSCKCSDYGFCGLSCLLEDPCVHDVCANGGVCIENCGEIADYYCNCTGQYTGKNCTEEAVSEKESRITPRDIAMVVIPVVIGLLIIGGIFLVAFLMMARNKRATRGTYSPSAQEYCNPRLEMDNVLKVPPQERLI